MTTSLRYPPTLSSLLDHEDYHTYFRKNTKLLPSISPNPPWQIMAETLEGKWKRARRMTFAEASTLVDSLLDQPDVYRDVAIISRRRIFKVPSFGHELMQPGEEWCGRCRRPTLFLPYGRKHPALADAACIVEGVHRCYFCGAQEGIAQSWTRT
jgi:hypothetical protein